MTFFYVLANITPLDKITSKDYKALQMAISQAEKSAFTSSRRLGACLVIQGQCILRGKPT
jgi:hypothetical protein